MLALKNKLSFTNMRILFIIVSSFFVMYIYNIAMDTLIICMLFISSYCIGSYFKLNIYKVKVQVMIQTAIGLGIIGVVIYYILLFGFGNKSIYICLLILPIILRYRNICELYFNNKDKMLITLKYYRRYIYLILSLFTFYILYGSAPMDKYDTLTKHLPITVYAAQLGEWYTNVIESLVYGESMLMQYTYSTLFYTLGAYKALVLFNVVLFFIVFFTLLEISKNIYNKTNCILLTCVYFTTPMFFEFSTVFYLEILPLYFFFTAVLIVINLNKDTVWRNVIHMAFLVGCSIFTKLTISYSALIIGLIAIFLCVKYAIVNTLPIIAIIKRFIFCSLLLCTPFITSILIMWYKTGNPLLPVYNKIFKSPYFTIDNFVDPFNSNPLNLSIKSLLDIVFHTSKNIEMNDGGIGVFLLLIIIIPFAILILKDKKFIVWSIVPFVTFAISCIFTYNLRYSISIFMLLLCIIIISVSILVNKLKAKQRKVVYLLLGFILVAPNIIYIYKGYSIEAKILPNDNITQTDNTSVLDEVPSNKKVFSLNDPFKGDFDGFFNSYMWHNTYTLAKLESGELDWKNYIKSFDYILYQKDTPLIDENSYLTELIKNSDEESSLIEKYSESNTHILYKVKKETQTLEIITEENFSYPKISQTSIPITTTINNEWEYYIITQEIENKNRTPITMRFQINWYDKDGKFLDTNINTFIVNNEKGVFISEPINKNEKAKYGVVYFTTHNDEEVLLYGYKVEGYKKQDNYIENESKKYYFRELLN